MSFAPVLPAEPVTATSVRGKRARGRVAEWASKRRCTSGSPAAARRRDASGLLHERADVPPR